MAGGSCAHPLLSRFCGVALQWHHKGHKTARMKNTRKKATTSMTKKTTTERTTTHISQTKLQKNNWKLQKNKWSDNQEDNEAHNEYIV